MRIPKLPAQQLSIAFAVLTALTTATGCKQTEVTDLRIRQLDTLQAARLAAKIDSNFKPQLADGLSLEVWGVDSLVISPIAIDIDDQGKIYYTTTNRQKNSEFDIRGHRDWEIESISLQTIEDKRAFLRKTLSPENSK